MGSTMVLPGVKGQALLTHLCRTCLPPPQSSFCHKRGIQCVDRCVWALLQHLPTSAISQVLFPGGGACTAAAPGGVSGSETCPGAGRCCWGVMAPGLPLLPHMTAAAAPVTFQVEIACVGGRGHYFMRWGGEGFPRTLSAALFPGTILPVPLSPHSGSGRAWQGGRCRAPCPFSSPCRILLCSCMETGSGEGRKASSGVATAAPQYAGAEGVNRGCELGMRPLCIQFRCE